MNTQEKIILVAEFMGATLSKNDIGDDSYYFEVSPVEGRNYFQVEELDYHKNWKLLMPVIEKISRLKKWNCEKCYDNLYPVTFGMINNETDNPMFRFNRFCVHESDLLINAAYEAVVEVIEYYYSHLEEFKSN